MSPEWQAWAERHASIFALTTEADGKMLREWCSLFHMAGWTPADLREATDWIAMHAPPRFRSEHLASLQSRVRSVRQGRLPDDEVPDDIGTCTLCRGAGLVPVPNPRSLAIGRWSTMAVACNCGLGRWFADHGNHLRLNVYAASHPDWQATMDEHDALLKRHAKAHTSAKAIDEALGAIRRRMQQRQREPGEDDLEECL